MTLEFGRIKTRGDYFIFYGRLTSLRCKRMVSQFKYKDKEEQRRGPAAPLGVQVLLWGPRVGFGVPEYPLNLYSN